MPSERSEDVWVDEMDGPERLERAKKRRDEQLKRWGTRETNSNEEPSSKRKPKRNIQFVPNIVMIEAATRCDLDEVASLLESGVSPDLANEDGLTALHQSCIDGCDEMVKYLVEHKANVNACDNELWTPLHAACACGHISIIKYLIQHGGDIMALNLDGNLPVGVVEENDEVEKLLDKEMLKLGYDEAAIEELRLSQGKQLLDDLKDSVAKGRSLDIQDEDGATAFHVAAANGWTNVIDYLLENEADFEIADNDGWQAIHAAAAWGHDTILETLVANGADLDSKTNDSRTPLDLTEETEIIELIEELKTKQVKYPRKGKGVRRKRSNTSNSSIKRTSIHEKSEMSHVDTKAEGAALFMKLQNTDNTEASSPDEPAESTQDKPAVNSAQTTFDKQSNSSRDENNSSGYVSEASSDAKSDAKSDEKHKVVETTEITVKIGEKKEERNIDIENKENKAENSLKVTADEETTNIKQSPVPKPPRLGTLTRLDPQAYINFEIEPTNTKSSKPTSSIPEPEADIKENVQSEKLKQSTETTAKNNELKTSTQEENANKTKDTKSLQSERTTLPKLPPTEKRKAPEPPDVATNTKHPAPAEKSSKKVPANEVQKVPTRNVVSSSNPVPVRNTAAMVESKEQEKRLDSKSSGRGFSFRSRKTCCLVM